MRHTICAGASPNLNANADACAYADAYGYSYPNTNEYPDQYSDTGANAYFYAGI